MTTKATVNIKSQVIQGTPVECGKQVFEVFVLPVLKSAHTASLTDKVQFYGGLVLECMTAMQADFGHAKAMEVMDMLVNTFDEIAGDPNAPTVQ